MLYLLLHWGLSNNTWTLQTLHFTVVTLLVFKIRTDCREIGEPFPKHTALIALFPLIYALCWFLVWPGTLKLWVQGKSLKDTAEAKIHRKRRALE